MPKKIGSITLYSLTELCETLNLTKPTLRRYFRTGKLKGQKVGITWYASEESLREFFNSEARPITPPDKEGSGKEAEK